MGVYIVASSNEGQAQTKASQNDWNEIVSEASFWTKVYAHRCELTILSN